MEVELVSHVRVLCSLPRKHEHYGTLSVRLDAGRENPLRLPRLKRADSICDVSADNRPAMRHSPATGLRRKGDIGEIQFGMLFEMFEKILRRLFECVLRS